MIETIRNDWKITVNSRKQAESLIIIYCRVYAPTMQECNHQHFKDIKEERHRRDAKWVSFHISRAGRKRLQEIQSQISLQLRGSSIL